jgi:F420-0:gamma-glutamyl ligase-like protein
MLRYIKHHITSEEGVEWYGIFALLIFVVFFGIVLFRLLRMKRTDIDELKNIPFQNTTNTKTE